MFNPQSDYALNKLDPNAIVYMDATGTLTRITLEDFFSQEEFQRWKAWSYESYHQIENADIILYKHTLSLHGLSEKSIAVQSTEDIRWLKPRSSRSVRKCAFCSWMGLTTA